LIRVGAIPSSLLGPAVCPRSPRHHPIVGRRPR